jgi:hypothetical protein
MKKFVISVVLAMIAMMYVPFEANAVTVIPAKKAVKQVRLKKVVGFVDEATTMHFLQIKVEGTKDKMLNFSMVDATKCTTSIYIGKLIEIWYKVSGSTNIAVRVKASSVYSLAMGKWTTPDPINKKLRMGVQLLSEGKARSIRMATLPYSSWEVLSSNNKLILHGKSIGNGQTFDVADTVSLVKTKKGWAMKHQGDTPDSYYYKTK